MLTTAGFLFLHPTPVPDDEDDDPHIHIIRTIKSGVCHKKVVLMTFHNFTKQVLGFFYYASSSTLASLLVFCTILFFLAPIPKWGHRVEAVGLVIRRGGSSNMELPADQRPPSPPPFSSTPTFFTCFSPGLKQVVLNMDSAGLRIKEDRSVVINPFPLQSNGGEEKLACHLSFSVHTPVHKIKPDPIHHILLKEVDVYFYQEM